MKLFVRRPAVDIQRDRNHVRFLAKLSQNTGMTILDECADGFGGIYDFESVQWRRQRGQNLRFGHGQIHHSELKQRMSAGQQVLRVHVGHSAGSRNVHVATHQDCTDSRAWFQNFGLFDVTN